MHLSVSEKTGTQRKTPNEASQSAQKDRTLPILGGVLAVVVAIMIAALSIPRTVKLMSPVPDAVAEPGVPVVDEHLVYREFVRSAWRTASPYGWVSAIAGTALTVFFTKVDNTKNLKLRVLDADGNMLGEYVPAVTLSKALTPGTKIRLKAMGSDPETYESAGAFRMNFTVPQAPMSSGFRGEAP